MKKILLILSILTINLNCFAVEEIGLEKENINLDYFADVYYGKIDKNEDVSPILKLFSEKGIEFKNSPITSVKAQFLYESRMTLSSLAHHSVHFKHDFNTVEPMLIVKFNEGRSKFMIDYNLTRDIEGYSNSFTEKFSRLFVSHNINDNQTILFGQGDRLPSTYDGSRGTMGQEMVLKSQLGRTLGELRSVGIRNIAKYKFVDYDIGLYDSTRYMKDFGNGLDFTGYIMLKPFANFDEKVSDFKIGSGYNVGNNNISYSMYSIFAGYDYKKFHIHAEYADADGYNATYESQNKADGFYTLISYDITPKTTILGRYDYFVNNKTMSSSYCQEYSIGVTYKLFKNMKFMLNYVNRNFSNKPDSNMILFATRFII